MRTKPKPAKTDEKPAGKPKLRKETVRELTDEQLKGIAGGVRPIRTRK